MNIGQALLIVASMSCDDGNGLKQIISSTTGCKSQSIELSPLCLNEISFLAGDEVQGAVLAYCSSQREITSLFSE